MEQWGGEEGDGQEKREAAGHGRPPTLSSFPVTTPDATVIRDGPDTGSSTRATPFFTGASTVVFPLGPTCVKLTTVPSGTALPLQSRTGSVSTTSFFPAGCAWMRRLQASEATCRTIRTSLLPPTEAPILVGPSL